MCFHWIVDNFLVRNCFKICVSLFVLCVYIQTDKRHTHYCRIESVSCTFMSTIVVFIVIKHYGFLPLGRPTSTLTFIYLAIWKTFRLNSLHWKTDWYHFSTAQERYLTILSERMYATDGQQKILISIIPCDNVMEKKIEEKGLKRF